MNEGSTGHPAVEVSVVIPAYNAGAYLRTAIESVLSQTLRPTEIIVIDDGSTDDTAEAAKSFGERVRYIYQENRGSTFAKNRGLDEARGEFIATLDADDYFVSETKLQCQVELIKQFADCGLVGSGWTNVDKDGSKLENREPWRYAAKLDLTDAVVWSPLLSSVMLFRKDALRSVNGFARGLRIIEDYDIVIRLILAGYSVKWLPEITTAYRLHDGNITRNIPLMETEIEDYLDKLFSRDDLPTELAKKERLIKFASRIRMAFKYYEAGDRKEMKRALLDSMQLTDLKHGRLLYYWLQSFRGYDPKLNELELLESIEWKELVDMRSKIPG
jgi:glycosyltransferase involved in cell wall biosynthesis